MKAELLLTRQKQLVDSLQFTKVIDAMQLERQQLVLEQKEMQLEQQKDKVELQRSQRNLFLALAAFILLLAILAGFSLFRNCLTHVANVISSCMLNKSQ